MHYEQTVINRETFEALKAGGHGRTALCFMERRHSPSVPGWNGYTSQLKFEGVRAEDGLFVINRESALNIRTEG